MSIVTTTHAIDRGPGIARPAYAVLLLTSVHHVYGAYIYQTPWRHHAVHVSVAAALAMAAALAIARARRDRPAGRLAWWAFVGVTTAIPVLMIGAFEGLYNHVVKDVLWLGGAPAPLLRALFPPPTYEMPNDVLFEVTGVLQVVPAAWAAWRLLGALRPAGG